MPRLQKARGQRGQISVLMGVMLMTFLLFFAFVINTGMLVSARINIQNAADLAAYAGASVQARQLTHISYLNYEMRRYWKKFLFRVYVLGNMSQPSFTKPQSNTVTYVKYLTEQHPITCVVFDPRDNYCQVEITPALEAPPASLGNLDAMTQILRDTILKLDDIKNQKCMALADTNQMVNFFWLFNTDPNLTLLSQMTGGAQVMANKIAPIVTGLGLIPREVILKSRIDTLASYVNFLPQSKVNLERARSLPQTMGDPSKVERTVQAFYSAFYSLGESTFPTGSIEMTELIPEKLLKLDPIQTGEFSVFAMGRQLIPVADTKNCVNKRVELNVPDPGVTVGVAKDPSYLTYYAVKLKGKARLLFSPLGDLEFKAYASARPFGSRIGPPKDRVSFKHELTNGKLPNASILEGENSLGKGRGFDTVNTMRDLCRALNGCGDGNLSYQNILDAYSAAMAPNPWETDKYNIINDLGNADPFIRNFGNDQYARIWAPILPLNSSPSEMKAQVADAIRNFFLKQSGAITQAKDARATVDAQLQSQLIDQLSNYIQRIDSPAGGEDEESRNIATIRDPYGTINGPYRGQYGPPTFATDRNQVATSWNNIKDGAFEELGRVGYSVKLVSFDSLTRRTVTTSSWNPASFQNSATLDGESEQDVPLLSH